MAWLVADFSATAQTFTTLVDFGGSDGRSALAGLTLSGNTLYGTTSVGYGTVFRIDLPLTPAELVEQLIAQVNASGLRHRQPLLATLNAALASIERGNCHSAVGQLGAFQNKVRAQISDAVLANELMEDAGQVIAALDCDGSTQVAAKIRSLKRQANGRLQLQIEGVASQVFVIEVSTNLVDWEAVGLAKINEDGSFEFEDPEAPNHQSRFYRVVNP